MKVRCYEMLRSSSIGISGKCSVAERQENRLRNRWFNVLPFDEHRIKIQVRRDTLIGSCLLNDLVQLISSRLTLILLLHPTQAGIHSQGQVRSFKL